jgi:hypothetical protein
MRLPRSVPALAAAALAGVLLATLLASVRGSGQEAASGPGVAPAVPLPSPLPPRAGGDLSSFQGMGTWVDIYDGSWSDPRAAVADMAARGVRTLYLETSNFHRGTPFVYKGQTAKFIDAAHAYGVRIVAWYLPGFLDVSQDLRRSLAAIRFRTAKGNAFDAFGLDIEAPDVKDPDVRSLRLVDLSAQLRDAVGGAYPLGAIIPSPRGMERNPTYWPDFPYPQVAGYYDAFLPMTYYTWRVKGIDGARWYVSKNIEIIRREVGTDQEPIHVIGGIANESTDQETRGFVQAVREHGIIGASFYTFPFTARSEWPILRHIQPNPVQTPALPAPLGATAMGNIPGGDTTHPKEVVYRTAGKAGTWALSYKAYDAQKAEVSIFVNWVLLGRVHAGSGGGWAGAATASIPASMLSDTSENVISFVAAGDAPDWSVWGVRDVGLTRIAAPSPSASTTTAPPTP